MLEYALERQRGDAVDLTGLSLTVLYHAPLLALVKNLVLNDNHLRRPMPHLAALQCCEVRRRRQARGELDGRELYAKSNAPLVLLQTLSMDRNELASLSGWGAMPSLHTLSLRDNALVSVDSLAPLAGCPRLRELDIRGNPVTSMGPVALRGAVKAVLPGLGTLNGEPL